MTIFPRTEEFAVTSRFAQTTLAFGLGLGLLGSLLFFDIERPGIALTLWLTGFGIAAAALVKRFRTQHLPLVIAWSVIAILAASMLVLRLNPVSILTMLTMILLAAVVVTMELRGISLQQTSINGFIVSGLRLPLQAVTGCFALLGKANLRSNVSDPSLLSLLRGLLIALPLALLFGALFSNADAVFENALSRILQFFGPDMPEHIVIALIFGWLGTGLLTSISSIELDSGQLQMSGFRLGDIETTVIMTVLLTLFLMFVVIQLPYLFGGRETIEATSGLTLAAYARRGFFELVSVSGIALLVLVILNSATQNKRRFTQLAIALLACLFLILISAGQRLYLYMDGFGLTLSRLAAAVLMCWIALGLLLFAVCLLRSSDRGFIPGLVYSAIVFAFGLTLLSPPRLVADYNIEQASRTGMDLDVQYLSTLGVEVIPLLLDNFEQLDASQRCQLSWQWHEQFDLLDGEEKTTSQGWRDWNLAYERARKALIEHKEELPTLVTFSHNTNDSSSSYRPPLPAFMPFGVACDARIISGLR